MSTPLTTAQIQALMESKRNLNPMSEWHFDPFAFARAVEAAHGINARCQYCDDTGDVHGMDGEWRGTCTCPAGTNPTTSKADAMCRGGR